MAGDSAFTVAGEDDLIPISAIQHMLYCPRQCALIHSEREWAENRYTSEGRVLHARVDSGQPESRPAVRIERSVPVRSLRLGITGLVDLVEVRPGPRLYPVEYKRGRPKLHRADEVQLCAQALCLEEMLETGVPEGALFYGKNRRRKVIAFDEVLREFTESVVTDTIRMLKSGRTPEPRYAPRKCDNCSLMTICQPSAPHPPDGVRRWIRKAVEN